jgi:saccharopine dehydrogenase-like protein
VSSVLLVGAGAVGRRAARQLAESEEIDRLLIADRHPDRARAVAGAVGGEAIEWSPEKPLPDDVVAVAGAVEGRAERALAERALEARVPLACSSDGPEAVTALLDLDDAAREAGIVLAVGCGLAPGLSDVLARHAGGALEVVDEVHVARSGVAGVACARALGHAFHGSVVEWRDGAWIRERAGSGRQLIWFPEPVGGRDCRRAGSGQAALLVDAFPGVRRATMRLAGDGQGTAGGLRARRRAAGEPEEGWGAAWVEVRGRRGRTQEILVYGVVDRTAIVAGTVLAVAAIGLVRGLATQTGAHGLGALFDPVPFLAELARRGVKAASFEGAG